MNGFYQRVFMKKYILSILFLGITFCYAQNNYLFFGVRSGINTSIMWQEVSPEGFTIVGTHIGYHVGPTIHFEPKHFIGFNSGLIFNTTGWVNETETLADTLLYRKDVFKNIQLPLTTTIKIGVGEFGRIIIETGGYLNFTMTGYSNMKEVGGEIYEEAVTWYRFEESDGINDIAYKRTNAGVIFGGAFQHKFITVGTSYNLGLVDITKNEYVMHNHTWNFYVIFRTWKRKI